MYHSARKTLASSSAVAERPRDSTYVENFAKLIYVTDASDSLWEGGQYIATNPSAWNCAVLRAPLLR